LTRLAAAGGISSRHPSEKIVGPFFYVFYINRLKCFFSLNKELALVLLIPWYLSCGRAANIPRNHMTRLARAFLSPIEFHPSIKALRAFLFHGGKMPSFAKEYTGCM
jgi:hypothetical protein